MVLVYSMTLSREPTDTPEQIMPFFPTELSIDSPKQSFIHSEFQPHFKMGLDSWNDDIFTRKSYSLLIIDGFENSYNSIEDMKVGFLRGYEFKWVGLEVCVADVQHPNSRIGGTMFFQVLVD